jgi:hypothetical protein
MNVMNVANMRQYLPFTPLVAAHEASHKMLWKLLRGKK